MMRISGVNGANTQAGAMGAIYASDSVSKNIQSQIEQKQKELHDISLDKDMPIEEKMKKRQEIQQEINALQQQLRQHEIEQRKEAMNGSEKQENGTSMEEMLGGGTKAAKPGNNKNGASKQGAQSMSSATMSAMISADASMKQADAQGSVATKIKGAANVLESEIKMDKGRGASTEKKEAELADLQEKAGATTQSQMQTLADANKAMAEAAKETEDSKVGKEGSTVKKTDKGEPDGKEQAVKKAGESESDKAKNADNTVGTEDTAAEPAQYTSVDIYL